jgi:tight adherence protein B
VGDALAFTVELSEKPIREEIELALREIRVGSTAEEALLAAAGRAGAPALDVVVSTLIIGQKTGGDLPRILEVTSASLRELKRLEEHTNKVTRDPKRGFVAATLVSIGAIVVVGRIIPGFLERLLTTPKGQVVLLYCVAAFAGAVLFAWRAMQKSV